jgi:hypothetical protein
MGARRAGVRVGSRAAAACAVACLVGQGACDVLTVIEDPRYAALGDGEPTGAPDATVDGRADAAEPADAPRDVTPGDARDAGDGGSASDSGGANDATTDPVTAPVCDLVDGGTCVTGVACTSTASQEMPSGLQSALVFDGTDTLYVINASSPFGSPVFNVQPVVLGGGPCTAGVSLSAVHDIKGVSPVLFAATDSTVYARDGSGVRFMTTDGALSAISTGSPTPLRDAQWQPTLHTLVLVPGDDGAQALECPDAGACQSDGTVNASVVGVRADAIYFGVGDALVDSRNAVRPVYQGGGSIQAIAGSPNALFWTSVTPEGAWSLRACLTNAGGACAGTQAAMQLDAPPVSLVASVLPQDDRVVWTTMANEIRQCHFRELGFSCKPGGDFLVRTSNLGGAALPRANEVWWVDGVTAQAALRCHAFP